VSTGRAYLRQLQGLLAGGFSRGTAMALLGERRRFRPLRNLIPEAPLAPQLARRPRLFSPSQVVGVAVAEREDDLAAGLDHYLRATGPGPNGFGRAVGMLLLAAWLPLALAFGIAVLLLNPWLQTDPYLQTLIFRYTYEMGVDAVAWVAGTLGLLLWLLLSLALLLPRCPLAGALARAVTWLPLLGGEAREAVLQRRLGAVGWVMAAPDLRWLLATLPPLKRDRRLKQWLRWQGLAAAGEWATLLRRLCPWRRGCVTARLCRHVLAPGEDSARPEPALWLASYGRARHGVNAALNVRARRLLWQSLAASVLLYGGLLYLPFLPFINPIPW